MHALLIKEKCQSRCLRTDGEEEREDERWGSRAQYIPVIYQLAQFVNEVVPIRALDSDCQ